MDIGLSGYPKRTKAVVVLFLTFVIFYLLWAPGASIIAYRKGEKQLPPDLRGRVSIEHVRQLEAVVGEEIVSAEDYNHKREFVHALGEVAPVLWKVRKNYYREMSKQEFEEKILGFVAQLDPHSSYESQSEVLEAYAKLRQTGGGQVPGLLDNTKSVVKILPSVIAGRYGMLHVLDFNDLDGKGFEKQLASACDEIWKSVPEGKIEGIVLDLRGNRGGFLANAMILLSAFMKPGELVLTEKSYNSLGKQKVNHSLSLADPIGMSFARLRGLPLLILVDANSASCSEIVAGVLQYFKVGVVASKDPHTFGKGVIQSVGLIKNGKLGRMSLTTHEYFIGRDYRVHGYGIFPDIRLVGDETDNAIFEKDLQNPIPPSGAAPHFVPMKERNPALDEEGRAMLKVMKMAIM